jgi:DsbC/DsbD-like thiol-disulfide interchange protein
MFAAAATFATRFLRAYAAAVLLGTTVAAPAHAADASPWDRGMRSAVRLIAAAPTTESGKKILRAGIEIRVDAGWKTYWRYPGDSGVPPRFSFARSENLESVRVLWPAPQAFGDGAGGTSIGYTGDVILPLRVLARDPARPVLLRLDADYAICDKLCIPADGRAELLLEDTASAQEAALRQSEERVPRLTAIGEGETLVVEAVTREPGHRPPRVMVDVRAPGAAQLRLFAEGPSPEWALPVPQPIAGARAGSQRFAFSLDGMPPGTAEEGARLRLTAVCAEQAIEVVAEIR